MGFRDCGVLGINMCRRTGEFWDCDALGITIPALMSSLGGGGQGVTFDDQLVDSIHQIPKAHPDINLERVLRHNNHHVHGSGRGIAGF